MKTTRTTSWRPTITLTGLPDPANGGLPTGTEVIRMRFRARPRSMGDGQNTARRSSGSRAGERIRSTYFSYRATSLSTGGTQRAILALAGTTESSHGKAGEQDRSRSQAGSRPRCRRQRYEVGYVAKKTGKSAKAVKKAVKKAGNSRRKSSVNWAARTGLAPPVRCHRSKDGRNGYRSSAMAKARGTSRATPPMRRAWRASTSTIVMWTSRSASSERSSRARSAAGLPHSRKASGPMS